MPIQLSEHGAMWKTDFVSKVFQSNTFCKAYFFLVSPAVEIMFTIRWCYSAAYFYIISYINSSFISPTVLFKLKEHHPLNRGRCHQTQEKLLVYVIYFLKLKKKISRNYNWAKGTSAYSGANKFAIWRGGGELEFQKKGKAMERKWKGIFKRDMSIFVTPVDFSKEEKTFSWLMRHLCSPRKIEVELKRY